ncbi:MAG TPA: hypothetical protein VMW43_13725 [Bacteroidota bacterium]|nr:hypothetical protein [Bacteroidota bacterium]
MKRPISVIVITREPNGSREVHSRFDAVTGFPRLRLCSILLRAIFTIHF